LCFYALGSAEPTAGTQIPAAMRQFAATARRAEAMKAQSDFAISLMASIVWLTCSHLDKQIAKGAIVTPPRGLSSFLPSLKWIALLLLFVFLADIPLTRVDYHWQIHSDITAPKEMLKDEFKGECNAAMMTDTNVQKCEEFCAKVKELAIKRQEVILKTRNRHHIGTKAAEYFDGGRGVQQDDAKLEALYKTRSCGRILDSVDKSNWFVNGLCHVTALLAVAVIVVILLKIIEGFPLDEAKLERDALKNFAKFYGLSETDAITKSQLDASPVSKHIWAALSRSELKKVGEVQLPAGEAVARGIAMPKQD